MKKATIPNLLTSVRIPLSIFLIFCDSYRIPFILLYLLCGLTDVFDGYLARKWNCTTVFGAKLDSIADLVMCLMITITIIRQSPLPFFILAAVCILTLMKIASALITKIKFKELFSIHTIGNKATGFLFYLCPLFQTVSGNSLLIITGILAFLSSAEEFLIILTSKEADINRKSIFIKK